MPTQNILSTVKDSLDILQSLAVIVASTYASLGFNQWRREIIGRRKIELAEEVVQLFSRFPNVILMVRNPLFYEKEGRTLVQKEQAPNEGHITLERLQKNDEYFKQFDAIRYRFLAYFGQEKDGLFEAARGLLHDIRWAAIPLANEQEGDFTEQEREQYHSIVRGNLLGDDHLQKRSEKVRDDILKVCKPYLK